MGIAYIGTSGYSYKDWEGILYPEKTSQTDYLSIYAKEFSVAELNFSYYKMPDARASEKMVEKTGNQFLFAVKAHQSLTHEYSLTSLDTNCAIFMDGIRPFLDSHKLGTVLLQFPFSFHYTPDNRRYLDKLSGRLTDVPLSVEFRNASWECDSVLDGLRKRNIGFVNVDEPALKGLLKKSSIVTSEIGYIRFHGRNAQNWWTGDNVSRYDYNYNDTELTEWLPSIAQIMEQTTIVLIVFNNHSKGQAVQNAKRLRELMNQQE
jgi:uncharacterized protein YecE (DUF72 family)